MDPLIWHIKFINDTDEKILYMLTEMSSNTYLLNTEQEDFDLLEKYIYDIAMFHFKRLNIEYNKDTNYIEFWCKNKVNLYNNFHFDCDEYERKTNNNYIYPLLSNIMYLNDSIYPTILTNIDLEKYKYKEFDNEKDITIIFPKKNKHISFDGSNRHGVYALFEENKEDEPRNILAINLWNKKPTNVKYYNSKEIEIKYNKQIPLININTDIDPDCKKNIIVKNILNYDFFENLLYKNIHKYSIFSDLLKKYYIDGFYFFKIEDKRDECNLKKIEENKLINDIENIKTIDNIVSNNRFLQRFILNNIYSQDTCNWIINESEKYAGENEGWTTNRHDNYPTTDIPIDKIKSILKYILTTLPNIMNKIYKYYCIPESIETNILDLFIVKYEEGYQNKLDMHTDGSFLTFNIMLSSSKDYEGGGTQFNDGIKVFLDQGDLLVHSGYVKHCGLEVTKGKRYILVAFTNIKINENIL
jgi:hypothetical protein